jgi:hypothetical protein
MKRHQKYLITALVIGTSWIYLKAIQKSFSSEPVRFLIDVFPWLLLMWWGCYCLGRLGLDLLLFNDYPGEIKVLEKVMQNKCFAVCISLCSVLVMDFRRIFRKLAKT